MRQTNNLHVVDTTPLITPTELKAELPISERAAETVASTRDAIRDILQGKDRSPDCSGRPVLDPRR